MVAKSTQQAGPVFGGPAKLLGFVALVVITSLAFSLMPSSEHATRGYMISSNDAFSNIDETKTTNAEECARRAAVMKEVVATNVNRQVNIIDRVDTLFEHTNGKSVYVLIFKADSTINTIPGEIELFSHLPDANLVAVDFNCCCKQAHNAVGDGKVAIFLDENGPQGVVPGKVFTAEVARLVIATTRSISKAESSSPENNFANAALPANTRLSESKRVFSGANDVGDGTIDAPYDIERRANLSPGDFYRDYLQWGKPVIITDAVTRWKAYGKWNHDFVAAHVPEYNDVFGTLEGTYMTGKKSKRIAYGAQVQTPESQRWVEAWTSTPYFLKKFSRAVTHSQSFFSNRKDSFTGATSHLDRQCGIFSVSHFTGTKRWTLYPFTQTELVPMKSDPDPVVPPRTKWPLPVYRADVRAGELLVFYPGWWHKTEGVELEKEDVLSFSRYWDGLVPTQLIAEMWPTFTSVPKYSKCPLEWKSWMLLQNLR